MHPEIRRIDKISGEVVSCRRCPRLVAWREAVAEKRRTAYSEEAYWGRDVRRDLGTGTTADWMTAQTSGTIRGASLPSTTSTSAKETGFDPRTGPALPGFR